MSENWGPHYFMSSSCRKTVSGKILLCESLDYDLLREELIAGGLPLEVTRVNNPWYYRRKGADTWVLIGESDDSENSFPVEWDISGLENGRYEVMGLMHVSVEDGGSTRVIARHGTKEVLVQN